MGTGCSGIGVPGTPFEKPGVIGAAERPGVLGVAWRLADVEGAPRAPKADDSLFAGVPGAPRAPKAGVPGAPRAPKADACLNAGVPVTRPGDPWGTEPKAGIIVSGRRP